MDHSIFIFDVWMYEGCVEPDDAHGVRPVPVFDSFGPHNIRDFDQEASRSARGVEYPWDGAIGERLEVDEVALD